MLLLQNRKKLQGTSSVIPLSRTQHLGGPGLHQGWESWGFTHTPGQVFPVLRKLVEPLSAWSLQHSFQKRAESTGVGLALALSALTLTHHSIPGPIWLCTHLPTPSWNTLWDLPRPLRSAILERGSGGLVLGCCFHHSSSSVLEPFENSVKAMDLAAPQTHKCTNTIVRLSLGKL